MNATTADTTIIEPAGADRPDLDKGLGAAGMFGFGAAILATLLYVAYSVYSDAAAAGVHATAFLPFILLFIALLIALGFEFVNGFHDTANAVATVIYTNSIPPIMRSSGRASSTSSACSCRRARSRSGSSRCFPSS